MPVLLPALASALPAIPAPALAFFESIGAMEMVLVAVVGLLLFGGKGLPDMARTVGKAIREFKKATSNVENEVRRVMNEEPAPVRRPRPAPPPAEEAPPGLPAAAALADEPADDVPGPEPALDEGSPPPAAPAAPDSPPPPAPPRPPAA